MPFGIGAGVTSVAPGDAVRERAPEATICEECLKDPLVVPRCEVVVTSHEGSRRFQIGGLPHEGPEAKPALGRCLGLRNLEGLAVALLLQIAENPPSVPQHFIWLVRFRELA
eukprot:CAMPEP_0177287428 /NCGR_PEP_ID=MMETSP0367-20130122/74149_1 /TAXON_ID=447022 ORGANISM="Scrippsiella hangoei-like, Strain SHHI-4" /NCGR_SAMPLE_ID=MMETSP0367 /ASSEMBLY_ACC=CAM_ASM_000362 /LENGTH=111 /DNA_ID=CAMNT_0018744737 /DNA_START=82 /DNA_END=417 /DNA_ORIENTATION=-